MSEEVRYKPLDKPSLSEVREVIPDTEEFNEPDKAKALIKALNLDMGDTITESDDGESYTVNPRYVLEGTTPREYQDTINYIKKILTKQEIKAIDNYMRRKKEHQKTRDKIYYSIEKRTDKFYWRGNIRKTLPEELTNVLEFFKNNNHTGINNTIYHLLSKDDDSFLVCYRCAWKNKPIPDQREWNLRYDGEYRVLTDYEADQSCEDSLEDDYLWKDAVEAGRTTAGKEEWVQDVINMDGRGSLLNGYDGEELDEEVDGKTYYIYRTN